MWILHHARSFIDFFWSNDKVVWPSMTIHLTVLLIASSCFLLPLEHVLAEQGLSFLASPDAAPDVATPYNQTGFDPMSCGPIDYQGMRLSKPRAVDHCHDRTDRTPVVLVYSRTHLIYLFESGETVARYDVALGANGMDKRAEGDRRTPLGTYRLGVPRVSSRFGIFIPVLNPTLDQVQQRYTGSAIGIHGPERPRQCDGIVNIMSNWTEGCIAVANDQFIWDIAGFVVDHPGIHVHVY